MTRIRMLRMPAIVLGLLLALVHSATCATVTVNESNTHQTVVGIGAFARIVPWRYRTGPFYQTISLDSIGFYDTISSDISLIRTNVPPDLQTEENGRLSAPNLSHLVKLRDHGISTFIAAAWTPPAHMKYNQGLTGQQPGDNSIMPAFYDDFGRYVAHYIKEFKRLVGVDLYGVCLSNEPLFDQTYVSCSYTYAEMGNMLSVALPIIAAECPGVRIMMPDDTFFPSRYTSWMSAACDDPVVDSLVSIMSVHGYQSSSGIGARDADWDNLAAQAASRGKELWQTEQSETPGDWDGGMRTAEGMQSAFVFGQVRTWLWWSLMETVGGEHVGMWIDSVRGVHGVAVAHYGRYVRPGAVRIDATSTVATVRPAAFRALDGRVTLVLVNTGTSAQTVSLQGLPSAHIEGIQSTETQWLQALAPVSGSVSLPARSITTLLASPSMSAPRPLRVYQPERSTRSTMLFSVSGRLLHGGGSRAATVTVTVRQSLDVAPALSITGIARK
jgi:glucuronoarabinoxylan endo-1,4-beta-xylanase